MPTGHDVSATEVVATKAKAKLYAKLRIGEVSLVPEGAGVGVDIVISKGRAPAVEVVKVMDEKLNALPEKVREMILAMPEAQRAAAIELAMLAMESAKPAEVEAAKEEAAAAQGEVAKARKAMSDLESTVAKQRTEIEALASRVAKSEHEAKVAKARETVQPWAQFVAGSTIDELAEAQVRADAGDAMASQVIKLAKAAGEAGRERTTAIGSGAVPEDLGSDGDFLTAVKKAREADPKLTPEQARMLVLKDPKISARFFG